MIGLDNILTCPVVESVIGSLNKTKQNVSVSKKIFSGAKFVFYPGVSICCVGSMRGKLRGGELFGGVIQSQGCTNNGLRTMLQ